MSENPNIAECDEFFALSLDMRCVIGFDGHFKELNLAWEKTLGFTSEELLARPFVDFIHPEDRPATMSVFQKLSTGVDTISFENRGLCKDGSYKWFLWNAIASSEKQLIYATGRDITKHKQTEEELRASKERFRQVISSISDHIYVTEVTEDGNYVNRYLSPNIEALTGYPWRKFLTDWDFWLSSVIHPDDRAVASDQAVQLAKGRNSEMEYRLIRSDGQVIWVRDSARVHSQGTSKIIYGVVSDVTEHKRAEETLRESEERYRTLVEQATDGIFIADSQGNYIDVNTGGCTMLGYSRDEFLRMHISDLIPREDLATSPLQLNELRIGKTAVSERWLKRKDGTLVSVEISAKMLPDGRLLGIARDITSRVRTEEEIRRHNRELTLLNQVIAASSTETEPETILETACRELAVAFDIPQAAAILLNEKKTEAVVVAEYLTNGQPPMLNETIPVENNPSFQYLLNRKAPLVVGDAQSDPRLAPVHGLLRQHGTVSLLMLPLIIAGEVVGSLSLDAIEPHSFSAEEVNLAWSVADQVAGALARARLTQTHRRLSIAIEQAAENVIITDAEGTILFVNSAFRQTTGYNQAEAVGQNPRILNSGKQDAAFYRELWKTITAGEIWRGRFVNKKKDGTFYTEDATITPVRNENGEMINYVKVARDVTDKLQLEEQYRQAQKMEAIGRLTGGIAHDFNNLLTAINGFAELMQMRLPPDDPNQRLVGNILHSGQHAADLIRQLLIFSRKQTIEPKVLNLNAIVDETDTMLQRIISKDIQMETILFPDLWSTRIDPVQIKQVIVNLAVNARDAMPEGGRLTIETANVVLDETYTASHFDAPPGKYVLLAVSDTGVGMSEEVQTHIFEPFFTTKEEGKGTGLGLATVYGIVKQCGGHIWVYSEIGRGTTFKIYLPRVEVEASPLSEHNESPSMPRGTETILLAEDEILVRELAARTLREQGYTVLEAANGEKALRLVQMHPELEIHLLLTDMVMPLLGGKELANRLLAIRPNIKVLFTSGYTDDAIVYHGMLDADNVFLQRPFTPSILARKVREVLDKN